MAEQPPFILSLLLRSSQTIISFCEGEDAIWTSNFLMATSAYIPVGSIRIGNVSDLLSDSEQGQHAEWQFFGHPRDLTNGDFTPKLDKAIESKLYRHETLKRIRELHQAGWIRLQFKVQGSLAQVRVYILPDDVGLRARDRTDRVLRRAVIFLLQSLDLSSPGWDGTWSETEEVETVYAKDENFESCVTLSELFNTLPSPSPDMSVLHNEWDRHAMSGILESDIDGLKTQMLPYQRRSAAVMLQKEVAPGHVIDPRLTELMDHSGLPWYCDLSTGMVLREPRIYEGTRGGICAEAMGLGKTLICLSLILATRDVSSQIPVEYSVGTIPVRKKVGSLLEMAAANIGRNGTPWKHVFRQLEVAGASFDNCVDAIKRNRGFYMIPAPIPARVSRRPVALPDKKVWLTTATLIVVPANLVQQWVSEIMKHTEGLKFLVVNDSKSPLPPALVLADNDIILFSKPRFELEAKDGADGYGYRSAQLRSLVACKTCENDCRCQEPVYCSPLRELQFKRLITDEGHTMGNASEAYRNNAVTVIDFLHLSARWIVSGTPTSGLYGNDLSTPTETSSGRSRQIPATSSSVATPKMEALHETFTHSISALDIEQERKDLEKLGNIAKVYLKARPWTSIPGYEEVTSSWSTYVMQPRHGANSRGNTACLRNTLASMMIRHRPEDVSQDLQLPPLDIKTVFLNPSYQDTLSINMFSLMITSNAVTSERKDADYLFHPSQRKALGSLVANLRQASFFWSGFIREDVESAIGTATRFLENSDVPTSLDDRSLLRMAIRMGKKALKNTTWLAASLSRHSLNVLLIKLTMTDHEMPMYVKNDFPGSVRIPWSLDGKGEGPTLLGASQLLALQKFVAKHFSERSNANGHTSNNDDDDSARTTSLLVEMQACGIATHEAAQAALEPVARRPKRIDKQKARTDAMASHLAGGVKVGGEPSPKKKTSTKVLGGDAPSSSSKKRAVGINDTPESGSSKKRMVNGTADVVAEASTSSATCLTFGEYDLANVKSLDLLDSARLISTASSKLSYLISQALIYAPTEKIIIFYEADNVAYYIAQALEAVSIQHLIYAKTLSSDRRSRYLHTFRHSPLFRVLIMDISQAAFGLDISIACRVYFVNPVISKQVESQAIKRAHRIGQLKPVFVEILVLKGTIEEMIVERRREMSSDEQKKVKTILDDNRMYEYIRNVRFVPLPTDDDEILPCPAQMAPLDTPHPVFRPDVESATTHDPDADLVDTNNRDGKHNGMVKEHDNDETRRTGIATSQNDNINLVNAIDLDPKGKDRELDNNEIVDAVIATFQDDER